MHKEIRPGVVEFRGFFIMRVFISIDFPDMVIKELKKIQDVLPKFEGKKTEIKNLHLTLKFLGEIDEPLLEKVKTCLSKISCPKLNLKFGKIGVFSEKFVRIVWVEIFGCEDLQKEIDSSLENLFKKEERFMGHLTIARVKNVEDKNKFLEDLNKIPLPNLVFEVKEFRLMKSDLTKEGPTYSIIEKYFFKD